MKKLKSLLMVFAVGAVSALTLFAGGCAVQDKINQLRCKHENWDAGVEVTAPTCTEEGELKKTCLDCGKTKIEDIKVSAHTLNDDDWEISIKPTCKEKGREKQACSDCGIVQYRDVAMVDCVGKIVSGKPATCTEDGYTEYKVCKVCNDVLVERSVIPATEHMPQQDPAVSPTCDTQGKTAGSHCLTCGETIVPQTVIPAVGHVVVTLEGITPTCTSTGLTPGHVCSVCGDVLTEQKELPVTSHKSKVVLDSIAPTCTTPGRTAQIECEDCGKTLQTSVKLDATGHSSVTDKAVAPTCTTEGKTVGSHCAVCNTTIVAQSKVDALGHKLVIDPAVEPTCTENGKTVGSYCERCGEVTATSTVIPATGHTSTGVYGETCEDCGETLVLTNGVQLYDVEEGEKVAGNWYRFQLDYWETSGGTPELWPVQSMISFSDSEQVFLFWPQEKGFTNDDMYDSTLEGFLTREGTNEDGTHFVDVYMQKGLIFSVKNPLGGKLVYMITEDLVCNSVGSVKRIIPNTCTGEHVPAVVKGTPATCTTDGVTDAFVCLGCGEVSTEATIIPALGHTGEAGETCETCGVYIEPNLVKVSNGEKVAGNTYRFYATSEGNVGFTLSNGSISDTCYGHLFETEGQPDGHIMIGERGDALGLDKRVGKDDKGLYIEVYFEDGKTISWENGEMTYDDNGEPTGFVVLSMTIDSNTFIDSSIEIYRVEK